MKLLAIGVCTSTADSFLGVEPIQDDRHRKITLANIEMAITQSIL